MIQTLEQLWKECRSLRPVERAALLKWPGRKTSPGSELAGGDILIALLADTLKFYSPGGDSDFMPIFVTVCHFSSELAPYEDAVLAELDELQQRKTGKVPGELKEVPARFLTIYDDRIVTLDGFVDSMVLATGEVSSFHAPSHSLHSRGLNLKKILAVRCGFEKV